MKQFIKVFLVSLIIFTTVITTGIFTYAKFLTPDGIAGEFPDEEDPMFVGDEIVDDEEFDSPLDKAIHDSNRINILLIGLEGSRSDTIMLTSFDRKTKEANIFSIPRDTYYPRDKYAKYSEMQKINAVFGSEEESHKALMQAVEDVVGIPVDKYISVDYDGVRAAVNAIGGVNFNIPFHMKYTDIYDKPPLYIDITPGQKTIYGDDAIELLRFRTGDPGYPSYPNGDLGRVQTQQEFMKAAIKKSLSLKLPSVISAVYPYVKTNLTLTESLGLAKDGIGFSTENLSASILPGDPKYLGKLSFFIPNGQEITKAMYDLYDIPLSANANDESIADATE
ncbi:MAG: LCP family protein [Tissierellia bacterium]|jgi:LCP family protein required for cell wall assembly|nr:LCP family protein [Tissierellia bacterium]HKM01916.1 LCP family protein [Sedimentibacter sp.]